MDTMHYMQLRLCAYCIWEIAMFVWYIQNKYQVPTPTLPADLFGPQGKWACDIRDNTTPLSFQLQVTEDFL